MLLTMLMRTKEVLCLLKHYAETGIFAFGERNTVTHCDGALVDRATRLDVMTKRNSLSPIGNRTSVFQLVTNQFAALSLKKLWWAGIAQSVEWLLAAGSTTGVRFPAGAGIFLHATTHCPIHWKQKASLPGAKWSGPEADHTLHLMPYVLTRGAYLPLLYSKRLGI
jgi:hypothetical protein